MTQYRDSKGKDRLMTYDARKKSLLIAYLLWFFLPMFGVHRMYAGKWVSGFLMLTLFIVGGALTWVFVGFIPLAIVGIWWALDAILTYMMIERHNEELAYSLR